MIGARQALLGLAEAMSGAGEVRGAAIPVRSRPLPLPPRLSDEERAAHRAFVATLGESAIWREYRPDDPGTGAAA